MAHAERRARPERRLHGRPGRYTGRQIGAERYRDKDTGERLRAMNYDIHLGRIAGLPGRIAAFLASLVAASLPITGALIWWNRG
jgi:uncharacterized iron-regulated membrane protein